MPHSRAIERAARAARRHAEQHARTAQQAEDDATLAEHERPRTRGDCEGGPRPCPWAGCRYHLALEINPETGKIKLQHSEVWELEHTCALDVAERGGMTLEQVGSVLNVTRERVRQIEHIARKAMRRARRQLT